MQNKKKATNLQERFITEMTKPDTKNRTQAALKAGYSKTHARKTASRLANDPDIAAAIEQRKAEAARSCQITREQVLGATAHRAFATIDDALDENGNFDIVKARKTGAIHLVKSITKTPNAFGESVRVEFYSVADAQNKLGTYLGLEKLPDINPEIAVRDKQKFLDAVALLVKEGDSEQDAKAFVVKAYPEAEKYLN